MEPLRWHAVIFYRTESGPVEVEHDLEELQDLHDLVERGPDWDGIIEIKVTRHHLEGRENLTVEQAAKE